MRWGKGVPDVHVVIGLDAIMVEVVVYANGLEERKRGWCQGRGSIGEV